MPFTFKNGIERPELAKSVGPQFFGRNIEPSAPETADILKSGVSADGNTVLFGQLDGGVHHKRVARMETTGNVG